MAPTFSVITFVLNDRRGFEATAGSIVEQTCADFEWIVIDGASTDGTVDAIRRHAPSIRVWRSEPDAGVYDAMNRALALARGEFVLFMNAGDLLADPRTLHDVAAVLAGTRPAVDLLFGGTVLMLPRGGRVYRPPRPAETGLRYGPPAYHQATFVRRTLHQAVPHELAYRVSSDYYTIARMCREGARTLCLDRAVALHDFGPHNLSKRATLTRFRDFVAIQRAVLRKPWPEIALNTGRLLCVHWAYLAVNSAWLGQLSSRLLRPWRPQPGRSP